MISCGEGLTGFTVKQLLQLALTGVCDHRFVWFGEGFHGTGIGRVPRQRMSPACDSQTSQKEDTTAWPAAQAHSRVWAAIQVCC